ncbi:MAG: leucine-rich repeat protein, partial [Ruminococcus sp.]
MKKCKRITSLLLTLVMMFGVVTSAPVTASTVEEQQESTVINSDTVKLSPKQEEEPIQPTTEEPTIEESTEGITTPEEKIGDVLPHNNVFTTDDLFRAKDILFVGASSGTCGDCNWEFIEETGELIISGNDKLAYMYEYPWSGLNIKTVTIKDGVTNIPSNAFDSQYFLTSITIPDSVTTIGKQAFYNCTNLTDVTIGNSVTTIGDGAFMYCTSLTEITIPDSVTTIGTGAFYNCTSLKNITLPDSVTTIGDVAFYNCTNLTDVTIGNSVTTIGLEAFSDCTSLTSITIPDSVTTIGLKAFSDCTSLTSITLPDSVTAMGKHAFYRCTGLTNVTIGNSVTTISESAFDSCTSLTDVTMGNSVTAIGEYAFRNCESLTEITIPDSVKTIGSCAFENCTILASITIPDSVTIIGEDVFYKCTGLTNVTIGNSVTAIGYGTFENCTSLTEITLPDSVTTIGESAFYGCKSLTAITIPDSVTTIGESAFYGCTNLTDVTIGNSVTTIGDGAFMYCTSLTEITIPDSVTTIGTGAFYNCTSLKNITLPDSVTTIGDVAFYNCTNLTDVTIGNSVTTIGLKAFSDCTSLTTITIPDSVTTIVYNAFNGCTDLVIYGYPDSYAEEYASAHNISFSPILAKNISLNIFSDSSQPITSGYSVNWYDSSGNEAGTGNTLNNVTEGETYSYEIALDKNLGCLYQQPEPGKIKAGNESISCDVQLKAFDKVTFNGTVKDTDGNALPNATIKLKQTFNNEYEKETEIKSDETGNFSTSISKVYTLVTVSAEGYYNGTYRIESESFENGEYTLDAVLTAQKNLPENKITLSISKTLASEKGITPTKSIVTNTNGISFSLYNVTKNREITDFQVLYPQIVIGDKTIAQGDEIRICATDETGEMTAKTVTVTLDGQKCGTATIDFLQNGIFVIGSISGNSENTVMIFDKEGKCVKSALASDNYTSPALKSGEYTVVLIKKTSLLRSVADIKTLSEVGLASGSDYYKTSVTISDGLITTLSNVDVPQLEESKLYYTVAENTYFHANKTTVTTGQYVIMSLKYLINSKYSSSKQSVTIEVPEGTSFVGGSLTVNGKKSSFVQKENKVTVNVGTDSGTVRFYLLTTGAGKQNVYAYLNFLNSGNQVTQPIGSATFDVTAARISVPEKTGLKTVTVTGKAISNCEITVYDNGKVVGTTVSNAAGSWWLKFELVNPFNYSYHTIYAKVKSKDYQVDLETDKATLLYDKRYNDVSKVYMYYNGGVTSFDFLNPDNIVQSYIFYPLFTAFSFKVEFTGDASRLENVFVVTTDSSGGKTYVECTYDSETNSWVGKHSYNSFSEVPCSVSVSYEDNVLSTTTSAFGDDEIQECIDEIIELNDSLTKEIEANTSTDNLDTYENGLTFDLTCDSQAFANFNLEILDYSQFNIDSWQNDGYVEYKDEDGVFYTSTEYTDSGYAVYTAYPDEELFIKKTLSFIQNTNAKDAKIGVGANLSQNNMLNPVSSSAVEVWYDIGVYIGENCPYSLVNALTYGLDYGQDLILLQKLLNSNVGILQDMLNTLNASLNDKSCNGEYVLDEDERSQMLKDIVLLETDISLYEESSNLAIAGHLYGKVLLDLANSIFIENKIKQVLNITPLGKKMQSQKY